MGPSVTDTDLSFEAAMNFSAIRMTRDGEYWLKASLERRAALQAKARDR
jgi:hypothetical protein